MYVRVQNKLIWVFFWQILYRYYFAILYVDYAIHELPWALHNQVPYNLHQACTKQGQIYGFI